MNKTGWIAALVALLIAGGLIYSSGGWDNNAETDTRPTPTTIPYSGDIGTAMRVFRCQEDEGMYTYLASNGLPVVTCLHPDLIMD